MDGEFVQTRQGLRVSKATPDLMFPLVMQHRLQVRLNWQASKPLKLAAFFAEDEMWNRGVGHRQSERESVEKKTDIGCLLPVILMLPRLSVQIHGRSFRQLSSLLSTTSLLFSSWPTRQ